MVFALAGDSTTTSFNELSLTHTRKVGTDGFRSSSRSQADLAAGVAIDPAREVQFQQRHLDRP